MVISRINFTADSNLLNKIQNRTVTQPAPAEAKEQPATEEPKKSNKVRNWSIGMGAAAVLIGLGVLGRRGNLGEGVQKLLGGVKKNADDVTSEVERRSGSTASVSRAASSAIESNFPPMAKTAEDVTPEYIEKVNASIDRSLPNLDDVLLKTDVSKLVKEGELYTQKQGNNVLRYNPDGTFHSLVEFNKDGKVVRTILVDSGTKAVSSIYYTNPETGKLIKIDSLFYGECLFENFCNEAGEIVARM